MSVPDNRFVELQDICPTLANTKISTPFTIPENYFENFQIKLNQSIQNDVLLMQNELSNIAPFLSKLEKTNPFKTPDDYFIRFKVDKLLRNEAEVKKNIFYLFGNYKLNKNAIRIAATFLLLASATVWIVSSLTQKSNYFKSIELSQISQQEFNEFLLADQDEFTTEPVEKEDIVENVFNIESTVTTLKEFEMQQYLAEFPEFQSDKIN